MAKIAIFPEIRLFMYFNRGPKPSASISRRRTSRPFRKAAGSKLFGDQQYRVISQRDLSLGVPEAVAVSGLEIAQLPLCPACVPDRVDACRTDVP